MSLVDRLYDYLNSQSKASTIEYIAKMSETLSSDDGNEDNNDGEVEWHDYLATVSAFIDCLEKFMTLAPENSFNFNLFTNNNTLIRKPNHNRHLFEFAAQLVQRFHRPKSLKQLARFRLRRMLFDKMDNINTNTHLKVKYRDGFLKSDHLKSIVMQFGLPNDLVNYILFKR